MKLLVTTWWLLKYLSWRRDFCLRILPWGFIIRRKSKLGWLNWNLQETILTEDLKPTHKLDEQFFFRLWDLDFPSHTRRSKKPSQWILFKSPNTPSSFFSKCLAPTSKVNGQGRYFTLLVAGWGGFCFAPAIQDEPPHTNWMVDTTVSGTILYIQMIQFFVVVSSCSSFHANLWEKKGTFLVADHHIRGLWRR